MKNARLINNIIGWLVAAVGTLVYLLTMEPTVSFWDCGEFLATSYKLEIGHPPGAPLYQLLSHCFMLLAGDVTRVAWWGNALSALSGGLTAMFLFWTLVRLFGGMKTTATAYWKVWFAAAVGAFCYLFCDTAWFSAVESEVYSLSMLFSSAIVWAMMRWRQDDSDRNRARWLLLTAFLLGLSLGVHLLSLLTVPMIAVIYMQKWLADKREGKAALTFPAWLKRLGFYVVFFLIGCSTYAILPIRASANPPINQGNPNTLAELKKYVSREQYEHAPLLYGRCFNSPIVGFEEGKPMYAKEMDMFFPRMWKQHSHAEQYYTDWSGKHGKMVDVGGQLYYKPSFGDNLMIFGAYQLGYMYLRYFMWNFSGRYNDCQGFGNLQNGQFITGIPFLDGLYVGTSAKLPPSLDNAGHNQYFLLPLVLGLIGLFAHCKRDRRGFWVVLTLFLMTSVGLSIYLNHPMYEPRERDYAYVLSFYAFAMWIGVGAFALIERRKKTEGKLRKLRPLLVVVTAAVPLLMACQNWDDHDRSGRYIARDLAVNMLNSCDKGGILFTVGDNDTFPLWYLQEIEEIRSDVQIVNLSLLGTESYGNSMKQQLMRQGSDLLPGEEWKRMGPYGRMMLILKENGEERPVYFSHYACDEQRGHFGNRLKLNGMVYRLDSEAGDSVDWRNSYRLMTTTIQWQPLEGVYIDDVSYSFLRQYWLDAILVAENLVANDETAKAEEVLDLVMEQVPPGIIHEPTLKYRIAQTYLLSGADKKGAEMMNQTRRDLAEQLEYYYTMPEWIRYYIPYTMEPLEQLKAEI